MNVIELLKKDHRNVSELFAAYEAARKTKRKAPGRRSRNRSASS